jgi:hypothetical protein
MANATGSHFAPNCIIKYTIGDRESFVAYSIDVDKAEINTAYGAASNPTVVVTPNPHAKDHIFCSVCEDFFGSLENIVCPEITKKIFDSRYFQQYTKTVIDSDLTKVFATKIDPNIFGVFFYSVIWRVCLQQRLATGASPINPRFERRIETVLNRFIGILPKDFSAIEVDLPYPFTIITSANEDNEGAGFINTNFEGSNSELFFIGRFLVLVHHDLAEKSVSVSILPTEVLKLEYSNRGYKDQVKIMLLADEQIEKVNAAFAHTSAKKYTGN